MPVSDRMKRTPNCVGICLDELENGFKGRVYSCFSKEPVKFNDVAELFDIVEGVMDTLNFPAVKTKWRAFKKTSADFKFEAFDPDKKVLGAEELIPSGEDGYVLMVTGRDNATWQGMVYNKKKDAESLFNSEVELLKLLK